MKKALSFEAQIIYKGEVIENGVDGILQELASGRLRISYINPSETIGVRFVIFLEDK